MEGDQGDYLLEECRQYLNWLQFEKIEGTHAITPETLIETLSEGIVLLKTMNHIYKDLVDWTKVNQPADGLFKKIDNMSYFAQLCKEKGVPNEGIQAKVLAEGNADAVLSVLWLLMRQSFIVLRGAQSEEDIRLMAQQFAVLHEGEIMPEAMEIEALSIVLYYGIEGEVFAAFNDEEEIDCDRLPDNFDFLLNQPQEPVMPLTAHFAQLSKLASTGLSSTKNPRKPKVDISEVREEPSSAEISSANFVLKTAVTQAYHSLLESVAGEVKLAEVSQSSDRLTLGLTSNFNLTPSIKKTGESQASFMDDISDTVRRPLLTRASSLISQSEVKADLAKSKVAAKIDAVLESALIDSKKPVFREIVVEETKDQYEVKRSSGIRFTEENSENTREVGISPEGLKSERMSIDTNLKQSKQIMMVRPSYNAGTDKPQERESSLTEAEGADYGYDSEIDGLVGSDFLGQKLSPDTATDNLMVSEVYEEFERTSSMHIFDGFATIMKPVASLVREKNIQKKAYLDNFKVGNDKGSTSYYLRLTKGFNKHSIRAILKAHQKFAGYHFKELFDHGLEKSECFDPRTDTEIFAELMNTISKTASRIGISTDIKPLLESASSPKDLGLLRAQLSKKTRDRKSSTLSEKLLQKRLEHCLKVEEESESNQYLTLTVIRTNDKNYLKMESFRETPKDRLMRFYKLSLWARLFADVPDPSIPQKKPRFIGRYLPIFCNDLKGDYAEEGSDDSSYYLRMHGLSRSPTKVQ